MNRNPRIAAARLIATCEGPEQAEKFARQWADRYARTLELKTFWYEVADQIAAYAGSKS
jgi:hypothetical protein